MYQSQQSLLADKPMSRQQIAVVGLCILLYAIDGFDVLSISFASPSLAADWGLERSELGLVLSMELIGMGFGSIFLGRYADRYGRKPIILLSLAAVALGMLLAATAESLLSLSVYRIFTGLGIGAMLAATTAMVAETTNTRKRALAVTLMAGGYPVGAVIGGTAASHLLQTYSWEAVFVFGGFATLLCLPAVLTVMPESVEFLRGTATSTAEGLDRVNRSLKKLGHAPVTTLADLQATETETQQFKALFNPRLARITLLLTAAYFLHIMSFYYFLKWLPQMISDAGFSATNGAQILVWANIGGALSALLFGALTLRYRLKGLVCLALGCSAAGLGVHGLIPNSLISLGLFAALVGCVTNAGVIGLYAALAHYFPAGVRASGTGLVIGFGRAGAALGPVVAGYLFAAQISVATVSLIMAAGSLIALMAVWMLPEKSPS